MRLRFRTAQKRRADRDGTRTQRECRRNAASVANASGGNHRNVQMIGEPRHECDESDQLTLGVGVIERPAVAAGFEALRDDRIGTGLLRAARIGERVGGRPPRDALAPSARATNAGGYSPMIDETTRGAASSTASHCAWKSGNDTSPASGGTAGPHDGEKGAHAGFGVHVTMRRRIRNPVVDLQRAL